MTRALPVVLGALVILSGCGSRDAAAAGQAVPAAMVGTWRRDTGGFVAIGEQAVVLRQAGLGDQVLSITAVTPVAGSAALTLADGRTLLVAPGRTLRQRRIEDQDLIGSCAFIDLSITGPAQRLWNEESVAWLPRTPVVVTAPRAVEPPKSSPDDLLMAALQPLADLRWSSAGNGLVALARAGAPSSALQAEAAEMERQQRLAALEVLAQAQGPEDARVAVADRLMADVHHWRQATATWLGARR